MSWEDIIVMTWLGQDLKFWMTVGVATLIKWFMSPVAATKREAIGGMIAGATVAYYGHDWVIRTFSSAFEPDDKEIVVILLVFAGEHITRLLLQKLPTLIDKRLGLDIDLEEDEEEKA